MRWFAGKIARKSQKAQDQKSDGRIGEFSDSKTKCLLQAYKTRLKQTPLFECVEV
jgi:hypothetical protein